MRDAFTAHPSLTGLYSRPGWNHPGPAMFWLTGLFAWPFRNDAWATRVGASMLQLIAVGWLAWVTWRRETALFLAAAVVTSLTYLSVGPDLFRQPWNLNVPLPFFVLFLFLAHLAATGSPRQLIAMAAVASLVAQTHVGYASLLAVGFVWAIGMVVVDARRARRAPQGWRSTVVLTALVLVVLWVPVGVEVVANWPGNLGKVVSYFALGEHPVLGWDRALRVVAEEFRPVPVWLGGGDRTDLLGHAVGASMAWLAVPVALIALAVIANRHRGRVENQRMVLFAAAELAMALVAVSRVDEPLAYTFQWRAALAAFLFVACLWSIWAAFEVAFPGLVRRGAVIGVIAVVAWGCGVRSFSVVAYSTERREPFENEVGEVMRQLAGRTPRSGSVLVEPVGDVLPTLFPGVVDELDRAGVAVKVGSARVFGAHRAVARDTGVRRWLVMERGSLVSSYVRDGAQVLAWVSPLSQAEDRELTRLQDQLRRQLVAGGHDAMTEWLDSQSVAFLLAGIPGLDPLVVRRAGELNAKVGPNSCHCAVVEVQS
ncbi:MAG: hypothetical protein FJW88_14855 [Actinobacteria bacterium]|nr:hypothetical protein [Actinomycetota bacterium]